MNLIKLSFQNTIGLVILFFILTYLLNPIYYYLTSFNKTITVKKVYDYSKSRYNKGLMVEDTEGNVYRVNNLWWKGEFDSMEDWNKLTVGAKFEIDGYGKRIKIFGIYPHVYKVTPK